MGALSNLVASMIVENPWWLTRETRYISITHQSHCPSVGLSDDCVCNPDVRLMYNATKEATLTAKIHKETASGIPSDIQEE
jgi:hypothetical protein